MFWLYAVIDRINWNDTFLCTDKDIFVPRQRHITVRRQKTHHCAQRHILPLIRSLCPHVVLALADLMHDDQKWQIESGPKEQGEVQCQQVSVLDTERYVLHAHTHTQISVFFFLMLLSPKSHNNITVFLHEYVTGS